MAKNEIKLGENVNSITIDVATADISIYPDNIEVPIVRTTGEIDVSERYNEAVIKECQSRNNGVSISVGNGITMFSSGRSSITINNCKIISGNVDNITSFSFGEASNVELIVLKKSQIQTFRVDTSAGGLTIEDLVFSRLVVKTMSGDITLNDIDLLFGKLETMSGDIDAKILESIMNYRTYLKSISGKTIQNSIETISPTLLSEKHELEVSSMSGDVNILFKGRR